MTITRRNVADEIDDLDLQIKALQERKSKVFEAYRESLEERGFEKKAIPVEVSALKAAIRQRQARSKDPAGAEAREDLVSTIFLEITRDEKNNASVAFVTPLRASSVEIEPTRARDPSKSTVSIAAGTPHVAERPSHDDEEPASELAQAVRTPERELSAGASDPYEHLAIPDFLRAGSRS